MGSLLHEQILSTPLMQYEDCCNHLLGFAGMTMAALQQESPRSQAALAAAEAAQTGASRWP